MRLRNITGAREAIAVHPYVIQNPKDYKGKWHSFWGNTHPVHIEVGMGKGKFLMTLAAKNPHINYLGIEMYSSVLLRAVQKLETEPLDNLRLILMDAREITEVFTEEDRTVKPYWK